MTPRKQKKWGDLSPAQKSSVVLLGIVQFTLLVAALIDIRKRSAEEITGGDKRIWIIAAFVNYVGPIVYFLFGRKRTAMIGDETIEPN